MTRKQFIDWLKQETARAERELLECRQQADSGIQRFKDALVAYEQDAWRLKQVRAKLEAK